jgi:hypothetical protein
VSRPCRSLTLPFIDVGDPFFDEEDLSNEEEVVFENPGIGFEIEKAVSLEPEDPFITAEVVSLVANGISL